MRNDMLTSRAASPLPRRRSLRSLWRNSEAMMIVEFAYAMPVLMMLSFTSIELANLATTNMRVSQLTMTVADNLSRAMQSVPLANPQLREVDINDALLGAKIQSGGLDIYGNGRVILSSLQRNGSNRQTIFWQRCKGTLQVNSRYGAQGATQNVTPGFTGMGESPVVQAPAGSAIIFAEVTYDYKPLVGSWALGNFQLRKEAAFFVRDERDLTTTPINPSPSATASACNVYNANFS